MRGTSLLLALGAWLTLSFAPAAAAYPTMIRHGYASCAACHVDPSGAGALTRYGRAQFDLITRWHLDPTAAEDGEVSPTMDFLFGLVPLPAALEVSGNFRGGGLVSLNDAGNAGLRPLLMATDANASLLTQSVIAHVSVGFGLRSVGPAVVLSPEGGAQNALVSREHWVGARFFDQSLVVRAGRLRQPFGLRNVEHTSFIREATRTDINVHQQHGVAVHYASGPFRGELMANAGNYQIRPDAFRERGYASFGELVINPELAVGASSLAGFTQADLDLRLPALRHAHGVFARWAPLPALVVMAEVDALFRHGEDFHTVGAAGWLQVDFEPWQGIHIAPALEAVHVADGKSPTRAGSWLSLIWFALPHTELRLDGIYRQSFSTGPGAGASLLALVQVHVFL
jgi:hypothetical protein